MKGKVIKAIIIGLVVIGIGTGSYVGYNTFFKKTVSAKTSRFITSTVKKMNLAKTIEGTGSTYAGTAKDVAPNNNGTLSGLTVKVGDTVTAGEKLFVCTSADLTKAVTNATRNLTKATTQLATDQSALTAANAQLATDQSATIVDANKVSSDEKTISDYTSKVSTDQDSVTDATTALSDAKTALANQTVTAPIAGLVTSVVSVNGDSVQAGKSVVTVTDMTTMKVKVSVNEDDISSVQVGQTATITFDALTNKTFTGAVEAIAQTGTTSNNVTTYDVVVGIANPTGIRLGMNADVKIAIQSKENALVIPEEALVESNNKKYVRVQDTSVTTTSANNSSSSSNLTSNSKLVEITTGMETTDYIEVTTGVTEGQTIVVQLPSSSSSTTIQNGMGGRDGNMGFGTPPTGAPTGGFQGGSSSKSTTSN